MLRHFKVLTAAHRQHKNTARSQKEVCLCVWGGGVGGVCVLLSVVASAVFNIMVKPLTCVFYMFGVCEFTVGFFTQENTKRSRKKEAS